MKIKNVIIKIKSFKYVLQGKAFISFSQFGEDILIFKFLEHYKFSNVTYLDIGANHPVYGNNTYFFYLRGYRGVLVEPNALLCEKIKKNRPADKVLNIGIDKDNVREADYYMFSEKYSPLNTFSRDEAANIEKTGIKIEKIIKMPLKSINDLVSELPRTRKLLLFLDVEGLDEQILNELDFGKYQPLLICVETVKYTTAEFIKQKSLIDFVLSKDYFIYAETTANTIFCSRKLFDQHLQSI